MIKQWLSVFCSVAAIGFANAPSWSLHSTDSGWNSQPLVVKYFHNSEMQRQWSWHLLAQHRFQGDEAILDFGCGDGKITAELSRFVPNGHVLGVDISQEMLHFAKIKFPSYAFPNLTFFQSHSLTLEDLDQNARFDLICSCCVFHLISNPTPILKQFKERLNPNGKLMFVVPAGKNPALFKAAEEMFEKYGIASPWKANTPPSPSRTLEGWHQLLLDAGFQILSLSMVDTDTAFFNKEELVVSMVGTTTANWNIPWELAQVFFDDLVTRMCELDPEVIDEEGRFHYKISRIHVIASL